jgi:phosphoglycerate dehydrogenase-like enzyme
MRARILSPETEADLASFAEVVSGHTVEQLHEVLSNAQACITGWGTPSLKDDLLLQLPKLQLVAHTAGSVRNLVPIAALERGLKVTHAAAFIADSVAELVIGQALRWLRHLDAIDAAMKQGEAWGAIRDQFPGRLLGGRTIGIVGAGYVGRKVIRLFTLFGSTVLVNDPFLTPEKAAELGVESVSLDDLFARSEIVSLHAPALPETDGIVSKERLALLRDGGLLINFARGNQVDEEALLAELQSGRLFAALDVFKTEPLALDSPLRSAPNVYLSPHIAGQTNDAYLRQGQAMVDEVRRLLNDEALQFQVTAAMFATMA